MKKTFKLKFELNYEIELDTDEYEFTDEEFEKSKADFIDLAFQKLERVDLDQGHFRAENLSIHRINHEWGLYNRFKYMTLHKKKK